MSGQDQLMFSRNQTEVHEIRPYGATMEDTLPSFSSILGAGSDEISNLAPLILSKKISAINEFYDGMESPYLSAERLMRKSLSEKRAQLPVAASNKRLKKAMQLEIEELEDGLSWSLKKIIVLENERKMLISKLS